MNPFLTIDSNVLIDAVQKDSFDIFVSLDLDLDEIWTPVLTTAFNVGTFSIPENSINIIQTPIAGLNQANNYTQGQSGQEVETDDEARLRRKQSLNVTGAGTVPAIEARIFQQVSGVTSVKVVDNRLDVDDSEGRPPHSFESIVEGGLDQDIADKIWEVGPAGIQTHGNITKQVNDSSGDIQLISFSRPTSLDITVELDFDANSEEVLPTDYEQAIKDAIVSFSISEQEVGDDVTIQRYSTPIYSISGVGVITRLEMKKPTGSLTPTLIVLLQSELAIFNQINITVTKNP